ncbi:MAG: tyrosine-type recombinase/integrase [Candidatus Bathyarchaeia archaeon]
MTEEAPAASPMEKPIFKIEAQNGLLCPECGSKRLYKDGMRCLANGQTVQRFLCRDCGYRFSWPRTERQHRGKNLKTDDGLTFNRCSSRALALLEQSVEGAMSNVEGKATTGPAGATKTIQQDIQGRILIYLVHLKNEGYRETTIMQKRDLLYRLLSLGANLLNPESVKKAIASLNCSESYKLLLCIAYEGFAKYHGIQGWIRPNYKQCETLPFIPHEEEIDALISGSGRKTAAFLKLLKETGMRFGEAWRLKWTDIDFKNNIITCNSPEKGSKPRMFKVSSELIAMLDKLKRKSVYVFGGAGQHALKMSFMKQRKRLAYKLQNPRLMKISFHTIRHWKATMLYHETKDILYVMKFLGHRDVKNTLIYIDLEKACFPKTNDSYYVRIAETPEEITELLEAGFEYVLQKDGLVYLRKRK